MFDRLTADQKAELEAFSLECTLAWDAGLPGPPSDRPPLLLDACLESLPPLDPAASFGAAEVIARLEDIEPDGRMIEWLAVLDPPSLSEDLRIRALRLIEAHACWVAAQQHRWLVSASASVAPPTDSTNVASEELRWLSVEVGTALRISEVTAQRRIGVARALDARFPGAVRAMAAGRMTAAHTVVLAEETRDLDDETARSIESAAVAKATHLKISAFRAYLRRLVLAVDPITAERRVQEARRGREVRFTPLEDGLALIEATLPAADATTVWRALELHAYRAKLDDPTDARGAGQRRADALSDLCTDYLSDPTHPRAHGRPVTLGVTGDLATVLGFADNPGHLEGYGAISAQTVRELAQDARWRLMVTDVRTGHLTHLSTRSYKPTQRLADFIAARDGTCRFPHCERPAYRCDIDHREPYDRRHPERGGATDQSNCQSLCEHHHIAKHKTSWRVTARGDSLEWTSPAGIVHVVELPDYRPPKMCDPPNLSKPERPPRQKSGRVPIVTTDKEPPF